MAKLDFFGGIQEYFSDDVYILLYITLEDNTTYDGVASLSMDSG